MCTVSIKVNDTLLSKARVKMGGDVDMVEWMQQQMEAILIRIAFASDSQDAMQRIVNFSQMDESSISLHDLEGILPNFKTPIDDLRGEYINEKYGL